MTSDSRLSPAQRHTVDELVQYLGVTPGVSRSVDEIVARLPAYRWRVGAVGFVEEKMAALEVFGLVAPVDGGWALTEAGAELIRRGIAEAQAALERPSPPK
ncbi:hypothetical protein [Azospirillum sp. TSO5]|uniref:hypothetical protein n=1 Tax=Azospirillum sp. TSO5 TaxID=716760 RepID=UPI000D61DBA5|nr:hypothetical protein [Azospirillum sp. TSO5]PWC98064.1 hypothetical protein TSO5_03430 [Azospirillum sp. TSO5]